MRENAYDKAIEQISEVPRRVDSKREPVLRELKKVGEAFVSAIKTKKAIDTIRYEVGHFGTRGNAFALNFFFVDDSSVVLSSLTCSFEENAAYPCVLSAGSRTVICSDLKEVKNELVVFCSVVGYKLLSEIEKVKASSALPGPNPKGGSTCAAELSGNPTPSEAEP